MKVNLLKYKIYIVSLLFILIIVALVYFFYPFKPSLEDIKENRINYLNNLQDILKDEWYTFTTQELQNSLLFIDTLYVEKVINVEEKYYYLPEEWQKLSYREQYLILLPNN